MTAWGTEWACRAVGRFSTVVDAARPLMVRWRGGKRRSDGHDKTGLVQGNRPATLIRFPGDVSLVRYGSLAHTLWRAQELTLIDRHRHFLEKPLADFGCGDGSLGSALFSEIEFGVDNDPEALEACEKQRAYGRLIQTEFDALPTPDGAWGAILANSVLEHTHHPKQWILEMARVLRPGGVLMITVPVLGFARHLDRYFGRKESRRINRAYHHYSLFEPDQWIEWFNDARLDPMVTIGYQDSRFTFWYRMLRLVGERGLGSVPGVQEKIWQRIETRVVEMVRASVGGVKDPANLFLVGRRR